MEFVMLRDKLKFITLRYKLLLSPISYSNDKLLIRRVRCIWNVYPRDIERKLKENEIEPTVQLANTSKQIFTLNRVFGRIFIHVIAIV